jgi:hypothetical protein
MLQFLKANHLIACHQYLLNANLLLLSPQPLRQYTIPLNRNTLLDILKLHPPGGPFQQIPYRHHCVFNKDLLPEPVPSEFVYDSEHILPQLTGVFD